ncbi:MAG: phytanoyl-CoA dioxygenase family protein [Candidatus Latescibacteria bacterium]|nr:phytanoyl-CoA dioxygenase family protein [Candidatus Latescibacterota bacterium]
MLSPDQVAFYHEHGYLRIPQVFNADEMDALEGDLERLVQEWATTSSGWSGPWRRIYMDEETDKAAKLTAMHDLYFYSAPWMRAVTHPRLTGAVADLLDSSVELHHSTLHIKPPGAGQPFPMHQDMPFYAHADGRYVDILVHLDDTCHANGEIRFLDCSHKNGPLEHITQTEDGPCTPHLPTDQYRLQDSVAVPAQRGDVVCFSLHTIHGSYINTTDQPRRMVRVGYRDPHNSQTGGQSNGRPGLIVQGYRDRLEGESMLSNAGPA